MGKSSIFLALPTVSPHTFNLEHEDNNEAKQDIENTKNLNPQSSSKILEILTTSIHSSMLTEVFSSAASSSSSSSSSGPEINFHHEVSFSFGHCVQCPMDTRLPLNSQKSNPSSFGANLTACPRKNWM